MKVRPATLGINILGDWNKLYRDPSVIAERLFSGNDVSFEVLGRGSEYQIRCICKNVCVMPSSNKFSFLILTKQYNDSIPLLDTAFRLFLNDMYSPFVSAYGINILYEEDNDEHFPEVIDSIPDKANLIKLGCEVTSTTVKRSFTYDGHDYNVEFQGEGAQTTISINQHNQVDSESTSINIQENFICDFVEKAKKIVSALGYSIDEEEVE